MTNLFQKSISAAANILASANRVRYIWAHTRKRKRDASPQYLLHLLSLEKAQNHQLRCSWDVNSYCAHSSALNNFVYPKQRLSGGISANN